MQSSWVEGLQQLALMFGADNLGKGVILSGMEISQVGLDVTITEGVFACLQPSSVIGLQLLYYPGDTHTLASSAEEVRIQAGAFANTTNLVYNDGSIHPAILEYVSSSFVTLIVTSLTPGLTMSARNMVRYYDTTWIEPTYAGDYVADSASPITFRRLMGAKRVQIQGMVSNSSPTSVASDSVMFTLPTGYRPPVELLFTVWSTTVATAAVVRVKANGEVSIAGDLLAVSNDQMSCVVSFEVD
jgi:hypothetical protein